MARPSRIEYNHVSYYEFQREVAKKVNDLRNLCCFTSMSYTPCTANAVNILLNVSWHVKVHYMAYIGDVQATSSNLSGEKYCGSVHVVAEKKINDSVKFSAKVFYTHSEKFSIVNKIHFKIREICTNKPEKYSG